MIKERDTEVGWLFVRHSRKGISIRYNWYLYNYLDIGDTKDQSCEEKKNIRNKVNQALYISNHKSHFPSQNVFMIISSSYNLDQTLCFVLFYLSVLIQLPLHSLIQGYWHNFHYYFHQRYLLKKSQLTSTACNIILGFSVIRISHPENDKSVLIMIHQTSPVAMA